MGQTQFRSDDTVKWWLGFGDGSDGAYSSAGNATDAPIDSACSGTATTTSLTATNASFTNGEPILIHQTRGTGVGNWELNQIGSYSAGTITTSKALQNTYTNSGASVAQVIQLKQYSSFTQGSGHTLTAKAWNGTVGGIIAFLCKGTVTVTGTISVAGVNGSAGQGTTTGGAGRGHRGGNAKQATSGAVQGGTGEGSAGAVTASRNANGSGGGGGYTPGTEVAGGGGGGHAAAGTNGQSYGSALYGYGGSAVGAAALTSIHLGGGGGGGAQAGNQYPGAGAGGGGIVAIFAKEITISGAINVSGGVGGANTVNGTYPDFNAGGGGGAGGSVLLKATIATLGTNKVTSSGGAGGYIAARQINGGAGSVGRIHLDYSVSYTGTTTPSIDVTNDTTIIDVGGVKPFFFAQY